MIYIDNHVYLNAFETLSEKRSWQTTLNKLKTKIENTSQGNKKITVEYSFKRNIWNIGDCYAYELHNNKAKKLGISGKYIIIKKIGYSYYGDSMIYYNIICVYNKIFDIIPQLRDLQNLNLLPLDEKDELYDNPNINNELRKIINENVLNSLQGDLHYEKITDYKDKFFHFIGNDSKKLPRVKRKNNSYLDFKTLENDLCDYFMSWNSKLKN